MADSRILDGDGASHLIGLIKQALAGLQSKIRPDGTTIADSDGTWSVKAGGVGTAQLADGAVTADKLADGVLSGAVPDAGVTVDKIADGAVTVDKLADELVMPVAKGGTGATTAAQARTNLGITPANTGAAPATHTHAASDITSGALPVSHGGTGATSIDGARLALFNFPSDEDLIAYLKQTESTTTDTGGDADGS